MSCWLYIEDCHIILQSLYRLASSKHITMEHQHFYWVNELLMAMFHSYVSFQEGSFHTLPLGTFTDLQTFSTF